MAYCSLVDIKNYIPESVLMQLSDDNDTDSINVEKIDDVIRRAQNRIDTACLGRFPVPIPDGSVPDMIRDLCVKLAVYFLYQRSLIQTLPEPIKLEYEDVQRILKDIQSGKSSPFPIAQNPSWAVSNHGQAGDVRPTIALTSNRRAWDRYHV